MRVARVIFGGMLSCTAVLAAETVCGEFSGAAPDRITFALAAGEYELVLVAVEGSKKGGRTQGLVHLFRATADDRSPRTGETARDFRLSEIPLYGWTDVTLEPVGAPMCKEKPHPSPDSQDPVYPGVLVHLLGAVFDGVPKQPEGAPILTIGTLSNLRNGESWRDGCGIGLFVQAIDDGAFLGHWEEWGRVSDGRGYFCMRSLLERPSN